MDAKPKPKIPFFSALHMERKTVNILKTSFIWLALLFCAITVKAQTEPAPQAESLTFVPVDSEFIMQVARINNEVVISLTFNDSLVFDYVSIERKAEFNGEFSQCKYISYDELKTKGRHMVKKDTYAYAGANDVQYRLKLVTKEGAQRIFPAINLPAVKK